MSSIYGIIFENCAHALVFAIALVVIAFIAWGIEWVLDKFEEHLKDASVWLFRALRVTGTVLTVLDCLALVWLAVEMTLHLFGLHFDLPRIS